MKKIFSFLILMIYFNSFAQNELKLTIPFKTKFIVKVVENKSGEIEYSLVETQSYDKIIRDRNDKNVFSENGKNETLEFCFCLEENIFDKSKNPNTSLLIKSRSKYSFKFKTEIQTEKDGEFKQVPNVGAHKGSITSESWANKIYQIRISDFIMKK